MSVCVVNILLKCEHFTDECFIVDMQAAMRFKKTKRSIDLTFVSINISFLF